MPVTDPKSLVDRLVSGDQHAFEELIGLYGPRLLLKAEQMLGCPDEAKDCVQECYIQVHKNIATFRQEADIFSWMYRILVNSCLTKMRKRSAATMESLDELQPIFEYGCRIEPLWQSLPTTEEILEKKGAQKQVLTAIQSLPHSMRDVLYLRDIEGHNTAEVAEMLSLSLSATKVRLHRARAALKKILEPIFDERSAS